jgi:hypothetical protein
MERANITSIYAALVSTIVAIVQIVNLFRSIQKDRKRVKIRAYIGDIDASGTILGQEENIEGVEYTYHRLEDGQITSRSYEAPLTGNFHIEPIAYKEKQALVFEVLNNDEAPLTLSYIGFRLPDRTTLPIPLDSEFVHGKRTVYPRNRWLTYSANSRKHTVVRAKGKAIFWMESEAFYQFLLTQGIKGTLKIQPFIENSDGKPVDGKFISLKVQDTKKLP